MKTFNKYTTVVLFFIGISVFAISSCNRVEEEPHAKNIILLIGDGMGVSQVYAGLTANHGQLNITGMKHIGFQKTYSYDDYTTDSAASGTAIATGEKTRNGMIGMSPDSVKVKSILEISEDEGKSTGLISTSSITHATPASFIAHQVSRGMYEAIAADFLSTDIELVIGGGKNNFTEREDGRNLLEDFEKKGYSVYDNLEEALACDNDKMIALTAAGHNPRYSEGRGDMLPEATAKALEILGRDPEGFFLMVEGSQIDWGGHANDIDYIIEETLDFDRAVGKALEFAENNGETLVVVTADHECGGLTVKDGSFESGTVTPGFSTGGHTGIMVPVFAYGPGAEEFMGVYENTDIIKKMIRAYGL
ncbi:MAG TPA: alkaline phosphatase [Bacteroidales bacterium]|nr:alkaline phosphatase [Bacteroidales bacterium]